MQMQRFAFVLALFLPLAIVGKPAKAADSDLFGVIAIVDDDAVAQKLGLTPEKKAELASLIDKRLNDPNLVELAAAAKNLPPEERAAKLKQFRDESEKMGFELLTEDQRKKLQQIQLERTGMVALGDPDVAKQLNLTDDQKTEVAGLLKERERLLATAPQKGTVLSYYQGRLANVLKPEQRTLWEQMAGPIASSESTKSANAPATDAQAGQTGPGNSRGRGNFGRGNGGFGNQGGFGRGGGSAASVGGSTELTSETNGNMKFHFKNARWPDVIPLFADRAGYSLVMQSPPQGLFNYDDSNAKTPKEGLDILNKLLLGQDFLLVPNDKLLVLVDLKNPIPTGLVQQIPIEELDPKSPKEHGQYDLVSVAFSINKLPLKDAEDLIRGVLKYQGAFQGNLLTVPQSKQILVTDTVGRLRAVKQQLDRADSGDGSDLNEAVKIEVYPITVADPDSVLKVLQTALAGIPDVRLMVDTKSNFVVAQARSPQQLMIRTVINKLEGRDTMSVDQGNIQFVPLSGHQQELVLDQVQKLWWAYHPRNVIRIITPSSGVAPDESNGSRFVAPPGGIIDERHSPSAIPDSSSLRVPPSQKPQREMSPAPQKTPETSSGVKPTDHIKLQAPPSDNTTAAPIAARIQFVSTTTETAEEASPEPELATSVTGSDSRAAGAETATNADDKSKSADAKSADKPDQAGAATSNSNSPLVVVPGPGGLIIASDDPAVMNDFKKLLGQLTSRPFRGQREYTVFYLRHARAAAAVEILGHMFPGGTSTSGGGNSLVNNFANQAIGGFGGGFGGGMLGALMAANADSGEPTPTVSGGRGSNGSLVDIYPEPRLNALIVQANAADIDTIEQLLKVIDQPDSPEEVSITPKPRMIKVYNSEADEVANTVRNVYANRLESAAGQQQQINPADFFQAVLGGRGGRGGRGGNRGGGADAEPAKMTVTVDKRNNALVVAAPDTLFAEVKALVEQIDLPFTEPQQATKIISLKSGTSPSAVKTALMAVLGDQARTTTGSETQPSMGSTATRALASATPQGAAQTFGNAFNGGQAGGGFGGGNFGGGQGGFGGNRGGGQGGFGGGRGGGGFGGGQGGGGFGGGQAGGGFGGGQGGGGFGGGQGGGGFGGGRGGGGGGGGRGGGGRGGGAQ